MSDGNNDTGSDGVMPRSDAELVLDVIDQVLETGTFDASQLPRDPGARQRLDEIVVAIRRVQNFTLSLSNGDLDSQLLAKGISAGGLKSLQSNLRHLTWQAQQIAAGDFSQRIDFMGDFSEAFNHMVGALDAARTDMEQRERELLALNAQLLSEVTVRREVEEALLQANKKLNLLSSITRHDINNQLTVLMGYMDMLESEEHDTSLDAYFQTIETAANRIATMIQFTKTYESIGVYAPAWQDTRALADSAAMDVALGPVQLVNDLPAGTEVFADPLIIKVFYNLMDNAVRYGGKITTIRFSAQESGDDRLIVCEDDGEGILTLEKEKIFQRGFGKNTGLGLFLSREILDITGITIKETGEPGIGARFEMTVPKGAWRVARKSD